jgi:predicted enzyme related to lactoylglutathione lyase
VIGRPNLDAMLGGLQRRMSFAIPTREEASPMAHTAVTPSPGFISIAVSDVERSAAFYVEHLGAVRDSFDWGPGSAVFVGWPTVALSGIRRPGQPGPSPDTTSIQVWWRASDPQALYESAVAAGVKIIAEPFDGPFGRTFAMADPDGYRVTVYERDQPLFWPPKG